MSELAFALRGLSKIKSCNAIQFPSGQWGFVGRVPACLAYEGVDGQPLSDKAHKEIAQFGGVAIGANKARACGWPTKEAALAALAAYEATLA